MSVVLDASALAVALLGASPTARALRGRITVEPTHAPHLVDAEIGNVLRRQVARRELTAGDAESLLQAGWHLVDHRHDMTNELARRAWVLRERVTFYDALYVALAGALAVPLLTADARLSREHGLPCAVEHIRAR